MDNQKTNDGNARNIGSAGSGSSMGKDMSKDSGSGMDNLGSKSVGMGNLDSLDKTGSSSLGTQDKSTSAFGSSQDKTPSALGTSQDKTTTATGSFSGSNMDRNVDKTASNAHSSIDKMAESAKPMADRLASSAHAGVDKVSGALSGVGGNMEEKTKQLTEAYDKFAETGREYVRSSPATSILVALAAGFTLSKIFGGRRH